jgi:pimeloyl-ACP methyl ester carboxylesterase
LKAVAYPRDEGALWKATVLYMSSPFPNREGDRGVGHMTVTKQIVKGVGIVGGGAAALAGVNAALAATAPALWPVLPGDEKRYSWRDGEIGYTVRGEGPPLLLLHGIYATACGYEMRRVFAPFAERYRVYCPDLIGFGLSDRPAMAYTPAVFMRMIRDFVQDVIGRSCVVVASSLTAAYVIQLGFDHPGLFSRLILSLPTGIEQLEDRTPSWKKTAAHRLFTAPVIGKALFNGLVSKPSLRYYLEKQSYYDPSHVTDEMVEYYHVAGHQRNARYAPAAFVAQELNWPIRHPYAQLTQPVLVVWGANAKLFPLQYAQTFRHVNKQARVEVLERCGGVPHDERAEDFVALVTEWLAKPDDEARWCEPIVERR